MEDIDLLKYIYIEYTPCTTSKKLNNKAMNIDSMDLKKFGILKEGTFVKGSPSGWHIDASAVNKMICFCINGDTDSVADAVLSWNDSGVYICGHRSEKQTTKRLQSLVSS